jgi:hypothetical protein
MEPRAEGVLVQHAHVGLQKTPYIPDQTVNYAKSAGAHGVAVGRAHETDC